MKLSKTSEGKGVDLLHRLLGLTCTCNCRSESPKQASQLLTVDPFFGATIALYNQTYNSLILCYSRGIVRCILANVECFLVFVCQQFSRVTTFPGRARVKPIFLPLMNYAPEEDDARKPSLFDGLGQISETWCFRKEFALTAFDFGFWSKLEKNARGVPPPCGRGARRGTLQNIMETPMETIRELTNLELNERRSDSIEVPNQLFEREKEDRGLIMLIHP